MEIELWHVAGVLFRYKNFEFYLMVVTQSISPSLIFNVTVIIFLLIE